MEKSDYDDSRGSHLVNLFRAPFAILPPPATPNSTAARFDVCTNAAGRPTPPRAAPRKRSVPAGSYNLITVHCVVG
jgi:hypothetical protein